MKKILLSFLLFCSLSALADEGMWLPNLLKDGRIKDMQERGLKLTAEDLYSINQASLKDAIVRFGRGCTGELVSDKGLLLTNHHCGFQQIQEHSSLENDYLTFGFRAMNLLEELPNPGLVVTFLEEMSDVTKAVLEGVTDGITEEERQEIIKNNSAYIINQATQQTNLTASIESLYYGNQYFLFTYKVYKDVRLVFAPPSSIGKFGGDTDNWMWPRHTGDFSMFRIYADANNQPAEYSDKNIPFKPKAKFKISLKGLEEGDFCFIYGFPGRTSQYLHSEAVRYLQEYASPMKIDLRTKRLNIMNREQSKDPEVRIKYSVKNSRIANAWKKWQGELQGIVKLKTVEQKQLLEKQFKEWADGKEKYQGILGKMEQAYENMLPYAYTDDFYAETAFASEILNFAYKFRNIETLSIKQLKAGIDDFFKDYVPEIDREISHVILRILKENLSPNFLPAYFSSEELGQMINDIFEQSLFADRDRLLSVISRDNAQEVINNDPAFMLANSFRDKYNNDIAPAVKQYDSEIELLYRSYMQGLMEMQPERQFYPDANSTLRIAYGKVEGFRPRDGVYYQPFSTLDGVMEKDDPDNYDYNLPSKLREIYNAKDYGQWEVDGTVPVCMLASNHTTGGNSGSPLLDADGNMIAINFDRCWESTMSDIVFDPDMCRNISVDIRYILFIIDKIGGASYLIDEMELVL